MCMLSLVFSTLVFLAGCGTVEKAKESIDKYDSTSMKKFLERS